MISEGPFLFLPQFNRLHIQNPPRIERKPNDRSHLMETCFTRCARINEQQIFYLRIAYYFQNVRVPTDKNVRWVEL